jgi:phospholipase/carboxylesterase
MSPLPAEDLVLQRPANAAQLILLFHGMGGNPIGMRSLGKRLGAVFAQAAIISVAAPHPSAEPRRFEWFSTADITDELRVQRVAQAMPQFEARVAHWQQATGLGHEATALVGFSQGATMALEASKRSEPLAGRVLSIAGRYAALPEAAPSATTLHFFHGKEDALVPYGHTVVAAHRLRDLGADITAEVLPFIGHEVHSELVKALLERLCNHVPVRTWNQAMQAAKAQQG